MNQDELNHRQRQEISHLEGCSSQEEERRGTSSLLTFMDLVCIDGLLAGQVETWELNDNLYGDDIRALCAQHKATLRRIEQMIREYPQGLIDQERKEGC